MIKGVSLYNSVVEVTSQYLGPAGERFIARQIKNRLDKDPAKLTASDLRGILDWIHIAMTLLTDDKKVIEEYLDKLKVLIKT